MEAVMEAVMEVAAVMEAVIKSHAVLEMSEPGAEGDVAQPGQPPPRQKPRVHPASAHPDFSVQEAERALAEANQILIEAHRHLHAAQMQYNHALEQLENAKRRVGGRALSKASTKSHSRSTSSKRPYRRGGQKTRRSKH